MKDFYTSQELLDYSSAIALIEKYEFYNKYVKPLENDYEELYIEYENVFDELQELKEKEKRQRQIITRMKNEKNGAYKKSVLDENDATRYRNMNIELLKKIRQLKEENRRLRRGNKNRIIQ